MPRRRSLTFEKSEALPSPDDSREAAFDTGLLATVRQLADSGLNPASALDLLTRLIVEIPSASKERMEQIKMMDKLLNTARAMMEARLKNEEAAVISNRLQAMEVFLEKLAAEKSLDGQQPLEVWDGKRFHT
ncbi:MAG TPA: hypothetical protein VK463_05855 [Desulfomonilaceae bacterium]|nr:hypothetical protein [Desulfomonilaceae bacterium]